jgi:tRNA pseudouridine38-40 synthase
MVRRIVGVLVKVGQGELEPTAMGQLLSTDSGIPARLTAPPSGLFLERVHYEDDAPSSPPHVRPVINLVGINRP